MSTTEVRLRRERVLTGKELSYPVVGAPVTQERDDFISS